MDNFKILTDFAEYAGEKKVEESNERILISFDKQGYKKALVSCQLSIVV